MWRWCVVSELGRVQGMSDTRVQAADWVQMFMLRSPGAAEATIIGPRADPLELVSLDGVIKEVTSES